jgi:hypothetical protein
MTPTRIVSLGARWPKAGVRVRPKPTPAVAADVMKVRRSSLLGILVMAVSES